MDLSNLNLEEIQMLAAAAAAANQAQQQQQLSRQGTPPMTPGTSTTNTPKPSANNTRAPTPTLNGATPTNPTLSLPNVRISERYQDNSHYNELTKRDKARN